MLNGLRKALQQAKKVPKKAVDLFALLKGRAKKNKGKAVAFLACLTLFSFSVYYNFFGLVQYRGASVDVPTVTATATSTATIP